MLKVGTSRQFLHLTSFWSKQMTNIETLQLFHFLVLQGLTDHQLRVLDEAIEYVVVKGWVGWTKKGEFVMWFPPSSHLIWIIVLSVGLLHNELVALKFTTKPGH